MSDPIPPTISKRRRFIGRIWATLWRSCVKYTETDGEQRAASFAYYALFSLLPLTVLLITVGTRFLGNQKEATDAVFNMMSQYIAVDLGAQDQVRGTLGGFMKSRLGSGVISFVVVLWCSLRFFQSLVRGVNRAWGTHEYSWWRLPLKNLLMVAILASALLIGLLAPVIIRTVEHYYHETARAFPFDFGLGDWLLSIARWLLPSILLFYALLLFYKLSPQRSTTVKEVWFESLLATLALGGLQKLFVLYTGRIAEFNVIYGTFGSVVALLMWIYLSGTVIIFGGCLCAARSEIRRNLADQSEPETVDEVVKGNKE